jgi:hypothetical protein
MFITIRFSEEKALHKWLTKLLTVIPFDKLSSKWEKLIPFVVSQYRIFIKRTDLKSLLTVFKRVSSRLLWLTSDLPC